MLLTEFRYSALKKSRRFVTQTFEQAAANKPSAPIWLEANYINFNGTWQIMEHSYAYSEAYKCTGITGRIIGGNLAFKDAVDQLKSFERSHIELEQDVQPNDASDDFMHVDEAAKIIKDQKYSLRQKIFGLKF